MENVVKFSEVLGVTNFKPFSLGKWMKEICHQKSTEFFFFTLGGGGKNAKFHHLNLLGATLRNDSDSNRCTANREQRCETSKIDCQSCASGLRSSHKMFIRNTPSTAGNSMTGSERPSLEPLLKKEASPAVLVGRQFWKRSGAFKCLEL